MNEKKGKIVDEKGRLFGRINVIDLIVLVLIVAVAAVVALKFLGKDAGIPGDNSTTQIEYTVKVPLVQESVYEAVKAQVEAGGEGAQLMADGAMLDAYVLDVSSEPNLVPVEMEDGTVVLSAQPGYVCANFTIRATITNPITQAVGTQEVRIGKSHIVKTKTFELVNGIIQTCEPVEPAA